MRAARHLTLLISSIYLSGCGSLWANIHKTAAESGSQAQASLSFRTVDSYSLVTGFTAKANGAVVDSNQNLFSVGYALDSSSLYHWIVRKSSDAGNTWATVDDYNYPGGTTSIAQGIAVDSYGLYVIGQVLDGSGDNHWVVRKSVDSGNTWTTDDDYQYSSGVTVNGLALAADGAGNIYAAGYAMDSSSVYHWIVRKSSNGGAWSTVDDFSYSGGSQSEAWALVADSSGDVYVAGSAFKGSTHWLVRESIAGGSFSTVDDYQYATGKDSLAFALMVDSSGNIYSGGYGTDSSFMKHWIVRKSADGGSWTTVDDFQYESNGAPQDSQAFGLAQDGSGNLFSVGYAYDDTFTDHWLVRKSADLGQSWTTDDDYNMSPGEDSRANQLIPFGTDQLLVVGYGTDSSGKIDWIARLLSSQ